MNKSIVNKWIRNMAPFFGLLALAIAYFAIGTWKDINIPYGMKAMVNQSVVVAVVATGAVFIYTLGSFDISLGASCAVSALMGAIVYNRSGSILLMALTCILTAVVIAMLNSGLASVFNLPVFVTTIAMLSILNALILLLIKLHNTGSEIAVPASAVKMLNTIPVKLAVLVLFLLFCILIFRYTKIGRRQKFLGANPICARLTGISMKKMAIIAFVLSGIGVGLGALLSIIYAPTLTRNTASSVGMDVIIAIVFGGMPVSGGARSKITSAVIGAFSMTLLNQIMIMLNLNSGIGQMVKAAIFILVVFLATSDQRGKLLPR
jgi:ribose transport system permease protein